jgi:hypothetical protein
VTGAEFPAEPFRGIKPSGVFILFYIMKRRKT